jgi:hypothetical protein
MTAWSVTFCVEKAIPLQAWTDPEGSRRLRHPDFNTVAHKGGKVDIMCGMKEIRIYLETPEKIIVSLKTTNVGPLAL